MKKNKVMTISITEDIYAKLIALSSELSVKEGKKISFSEVIRRLIMSE